MQWATGTQRNYQSSGQNNNNSSANPAVKAWGEERSSSTLSKPTKYTTSPSAVSMNPYSSSSAPTVRTAGLASEGLIYGTVGTAVLAAAEEMPLVGAVFAILGGLLLQVRNLSFATFEAGRLGQRLERLVSVVRQAGGDVAFAKRHAVLFESLLSTLQELQGVLEKISARSTLKSFFLASTDLAQLEDSQQALSAHLIDFSAALQSEVLSAMRDLASNISSNPASPVGESTPPPPFSMSFSLKDFTFSPSLQEQLAEAPRGSFGVVVFGIWKAHSTPVAIKLLKAENSGGLSAWLEEAELLRRLRENAPPNIVLLYGIGFDATYGYLVVMERLEGSLRDALMGYSRSNPRRRPALPVVLNWLRDTARGMVACHAAQVVHGDIKAANVLLSETRTAKLGDMGTARVTRGLDSTATRAGGTAGAGGSRGSPLWTAPELINDPTMSASKSCDVFSWAVLAWEILTELLPYHEESGEMTVNLEMLSSKMDFVKGTLRPDLSKVRDDAPPFLIALLQRAWSSDPLLRPTGEEIVALLEGAKGALITPVQPLLSTAETPVAVATTTAPGMRDWRSVQDPQSGKVYYVDIATNETSWTPPPGFTQ